MALAIGVISKPTVQILYGSEYSPYFYWLLPLLAWLTISIDNNFWRVQKLLGSGHDKEYGEAFQIGVAATIALNFFCIWLWGGIGAAVAPLVSELLLCNEETSTESSTFYRAIKRLRRLSCDIPTGVVTQDRQKQDVVPINLSDLPLSKPDQMQLVSGVVCDSMSGHLETTMRINIGGSTLELSNNADPMLVGSVLRMLNSSY